MNRSSQCDSLVFSQKVPISLLKTGDNSLGKWLWDFEFFNLFLAVSHWFPNGTFYVSLTENWDRIPHDYPGNSQREKTRVRHCTIPYKRQRKEIVILAILATRILTDIENRWEKQPSDLSFVQSASLVTGLVKKLSNRVISRWRKLHSA